LKQNQKYRNQLIPFNPRWYIILLIVFFTMAKFTDAQNPVQEMSMEEISMMSQEDLMALPLEDLMALVRRFKLSSLEELYERVLNPEVETASKFEEKYFQSPLSASVITSEDIEASGALNIPEALRLVPGLIVRQKTNGNYDVHIRGNDNIPNGQTMFSSENSLTLVMIDHRPVYNHFQGGTFWESLGVNMENIDRIEIIYGPSSALYGPNAVSGVIHIFTKHEKIDGVASHVQAQLGTYGAQDYQGNIVFGKKDFTARFTANYQKLKRFQDEYYVFEDYLDSVKYGRYIPSDSLEYFASNTAGKFPNPSLASQNMAANIYLNYQQSKEAGICFSSGIQQSEIQSVFADTREFSLTGRKNMTGYSNLRYYYKGLNLNASYHLGEQNMALGYTGYKFLFGNLQATAEYLFKWKNLKILPSLNYQNVFYDDQAFLENDEIGIFNGRQELSSTAAALRLDYMFMKKLRLTAAGRYELFNLPKQNYLSYQFTASYLIDRHSNIHVNFSKANRGPFMWDYHVNFSETNMYGNTELLINYLKNPNLKLLEMQMFELGFRSHLSKNVSAEVNFFYNKTSNYNMLIGSLYEFDEHHYKMDVRKENLPLESAQMGISMKVETVITKNIQAKVFATIQQTNLDKLTTYYNLSDTVLIVIYDDSKIHRATPEIIGGFNISYRYKNKFMANANLYYISSQNIFTYEGMKEVKGKAILNMRIAYKFWKQHQVFISGRNILNNTDYEFVFADRVGAEFLVGLSMRFGK